MRLAVQMAAACVLLSGAPAAAGNGFEGWPASWVQTYQRFEKYIGSASKFLPSGEFEILPQGELVHGVRLAEGRSEHLSVIIYRDGGHLCTIGLKANISLFDNRRGTHLFPGIYAANLMSCGMLGYQNLYPLKWFEIFSSAPLSPEETNPSFRVRMLEAPQDPEKHWPNERLLHFMDFHVFPKHFPTDIQERNRRVNPEVTLSLTNQGLIQRNLLDENLEKLLAWRIYFNGKLIEGGSASGTGEYQAASGTGTYQVFVGVEGPTGFMPVSNFLHFPLFPEKSGGWVVFPSAANPRRLPDFLMEILPSDWEPGHSSNDISQDSYYHPGSVSMILPFGMIRDEAKLRLFQLWQKWSWTLNNAVKGAETGLGRVNGRPSNRSE